MALKQQMERCLMSYSVAVTALFICSNIALGLYVRKFGFQCINFQPKTTNCSHELQLAGKSVHFPFVGNGAGWEKPVAHLTGSKGWNLSGELQLQALQWDFETGMAYSNMGYADGHLQIPQSGLYYVYSQVAFYLPSCEELRAQEPSTGVLTHNVYKRTDSYPEPTALLTATKSVCESGLGDWHITISQGALFTLQVRDRLFVTVNKAALVEHMEQKTFFGAFML
ncbi:tumor necrosis factor ligand superfamily member 15-like [Heterodontus francisci]|uniref:tumor necrosis factor ligand superfamily member 15-like n=1 Tax=Heterodontus francisci TaxID=7792 RepID=UPI00355BCD3F